MINRVWIHVTGEHYVRTHPNAPIILNWKDKKGRINTDCMKMKYAGVRGAAWMLNAMNEGKSNRTYYIVNKESGFLGV